MSGPVVSVNGYAVRSLTLRIGYTGPWVADVGLTEAPELSDVVTLKVGNCRLIGTVVAQQAATFGLAFGARIVGGAGGWGVPLARKGYHNDAGIKAQLIAQDAALEAGELLGTFQPARERVGVDYARGISTASSVLEYAAGGEPWWVDYEGITQVTRRPLVRVPKSAYQLLDFDEKNHVAMLAIDRLEALPIGGELDDPRLGAIRMIRDLEVQTRDNSPLRATAWCSPINSAGRLPSLVKRIVQKASDGQLFGIYRYRVALMRGDQRVDLQAINPSLPDLRAIPQWPGVPGVSATLALGAEVLVAFVDGDPAQPVLAGYVGPGGPGFVAQDLVLGGEAGPPVARQGDAVEVLLPPAQFVGTIMVSGAPQAATGVVSWLVPKADGTIVGGSGKVKAAT